MSEKTTRAVVGAPPKKATGFLPSSATEKPVEAADNMKGNKPVGMTFNMPQDWHLEFKMTAASLRMPMSKFLVECYDAWKREQRRK
ncbi:hypothetical protein B9J07_27690 [Sinorhizobium sp. LM21]|uniref:hypothetical protein n=1 Tax=Sinorhizobium sp. LM21 TaxID=1449788 RepID=UPI0005D84DC2|nr:hypothetical protein [Sinorhizobium sp. LM21]AJW30221.1 hypothetical protein pLM21S1_p103 [Sinorhizobium sp. LM21]OWZ90374.1 hypothetical protein B9J07_27690 [Sinorhizobium sp. LM21]